jgi:hypothetical protein
MGRATADHCYPRRILPASSAGGWPWQTGNIDPIDVDALREWLAQAQTLEPSDHLAAWTSFVLQCVLPWRTMDETKSTMSKTSCWFAPPFGACACCFPFVFGWPRGCGGPRPSQPLWQWGRGTATLSRLDRPTMVFAQPSAYALLFKRRDWAHILFYKAYFGTGWDQRLYCPI